MNKMIWGKIIVAGSCVALTNISYAENFKRFSVSAGWMHVMPQGKANPFNINSVVDPNKENGYGIGSISQQAFLGSIDPDAQLYTGENALDFLPLTFERPGIGNQSLAQMLGALENNDASDDQSYLSNINASTAGSAQLKGIDQWTAQDTGLEAKNVDTLGLTFNYYLNDHVSLQFIGGIPPKVDIKGKGEIVANMTGEAMPQGDIAMLFPDGILDLAQDIPITNLGNKKRASSVRAWTPAMEVQYQFGQSGVNKFRPFVGAGIMYAYFNEIKLDSTIKQDLVNAGHMIQNILDDKAGAALDGEVSSADPKVRVKTTDAIAPLVTLGATYDINENWFGIASLSYAKLSNRANIDVIDKNTGNKLIRSSTKIDIDPLITYVGVGYRF
ncbi:OmpW/AlkL family protein [Acinetobacter shaoyimingii]|uniref:OmpW family protein n=1 Tax=Acinetobacter shaoyimingii TaxID=2715164 RepID=A0A6G8RUV6_9GAMM|nr:OmpW family protein [Acinetobacter shaoyimingii]